VEVGDAVSAVEVNDAVSAVEVNDAVSAVEVNDAVSAMEVNDAVSAMEVNDAVAGGVLGLNGSGTTMITTRTLATRERPKLFLNSEGGFKHLINGVCGVPSCTDSPMTGCMDCKCKHWDFTLIQPLAV
jgi:hypothetical protein